MSPFPTRRALARNFIISGAALAVVAITLALSCGSHDARAEAYPRVTCYGAFSGGGAPIVKADGKLDTAFAAAFARYPEVTIDLNAAAARPDMVALLRWLNPSIRVDGYLLATYWYLPASFVPQYSDQSFNARWHRTIQAFGGFIQPPLLYCEVDFTKPALIDSLGRLIGRYAAALRLDGIFLDCYYVTQAYTGRSTLSMDSSRARLGDTLITRMRSIAGPGLRVIVNGPGGERLRRVSGTFREGFPGTLAADVMPWSADTVRTDDWLQGGTGSTQGSMREARFLLGTACVRGTKGSFGDDRRWASGYMKLWFDEYSVRPAPYYDTDPSGSHVHWLGEWVTPPVQIAPGAWRADFPGGIVLLNETWAPFKFDLIAPNRFKRIRGRVDPVTNNGNEDRYQTVQPRDAVFMVRKPVAPARTY